MYTIYVTDRRYVDNKDQLDWDESFKSDEKPVETHKTLEACFKSMEEWGSRWVMYPSVYIYCDSCGEVWEDTLIYSKCNSCNHERYDRLALREDKAIQTHENVHN